MVFMNTSQAQARVDVTRQGHSKLPYSTGIYDSGILDTGRRLWALAGLSHKAPRRFVVHRSNRHSTACLQSVLAHTNCPTQSQLPATRTP